jgi:phosphohistidine phosphatase SixA
LALCSSNTNGRTVDQSAVSAAPLYTRLFTVGTPATSAQSLPPQELLAALRRGGYVLVMRHASSPREAPSRQTANADNLKLERQLDDTGRKGAAAMGEALRTLKIPVGEVLTSPTYRALETVRLAQLPDATAVTELGDGGQSMQGATEAQAAWLRTRAAQASKSGNTFLVTHMPNIARAFPDWGRSVADGETVVLRPDGKGGVVVVGRIQIDEWPHLSQ